MILFFILIILSIIGGIIYITIHRTFEQSQSRIINLYSSVLSDMNQDFRDDHIDVLNLQNISKSIQNLAQEIDGLKGRIEKESLENQSWYINIINEFNRELHLWIKRHEDELENIQSLVQSNQTNNISEKAVLEGVAFRLEQHRQILKEI